VHIPCAGKISRKISQPVLEGLDMPKDDAEFVAKAIGVGVTVATFDYHSAIEHLDKAAEFIAQGDWHP
jgi:hypothetical protein